MELRTFIVGFIGLVVLFQCGLFLYATQSGTLRATGSSTSQPALRRHARVVVKVPKQLFQVYDEDNEMTHSESWTPPDDLKVEASSVSPVARPTTATPRLPKPSPTSSVKPSASSTPSYVPSQSVLSMPPSKPPSTAQVKPPAPQTAARNILQRPSRYATAAGDPAIAPGPDVYETERGLNRTGRHAEVGGKLKVSEA